MLQIVGFDISKYANVVAWFERAKKAISNYEDLNHSGAVEFKKMFDFLTANK